MQVLVLVCASASASMWASKTKMQDKNRKVLVNTKKETKKSLGKNALEINKVPVLVCKQVKQKFKTKKVLFKTKTKTKKLISTREKLSCECESECVRVSASAVR